MSFKSIASFKQTGQKLNFDFFPLWLFRLTDTESDGLGGLLGETGFLDGINLADYAEKRHFQEMIEGESRRIPGCSPYNYVELPWYSAGYSNDPSKGNSFLKKYPKELRVQAKLWNQVNSWKIL